MFKLCQRNFSAIFPHPPVEIEDIRPYAFLKIESWNILRKNLCREEESSAIILFLGFLVEVTMKLAIHPADLAKHPYRN